MDLNVQLFTGGCKEPVEPDVRQILKKLRRISEKVNIKSGLIGWNIDMDISEIIKYLRDIGAEVYQWLPVFSELDGMADFAPIVGRNGIPKITYDRGNGETFNFCCPANPENVDKVINIYDKHYRNSAFDGVFIDKIRFPSFIGGQDTVFSCYCDYCKNNYDVPSPDELSVVDAINPLGISEYKNLRYLMDDFYLQLFDYNDTAVLNSIKPLCDYFRELGLKIGLDLFAPFVSNFVGQNYSRLLPLADMVKPMLYKITNAPAGLPFEIEMYSTAFDDNPENTQKRKNILKNITGFENTDFISREITGIMDVIKNQKLKIKMYAGIELNYMDVAPVTKEYIEESVKNIRNADGIVTSWDLNTTPDNHIEYLLNAWETVYE